MVRGLIMNVSLFFFILIGLVGNDICFFFIGFVYLSFDLRFLMWGGEIFLILIFFVFVKF